VRLHGYAAATNDAVADGQSHLFAYVQSNCPAYGATNGATNGAASFTYFFSYIRSNRYSYSSAHHGRYQRAVSFAHVSTDCLADTSANRRSSGQSSTYRSSSYNLGSVHSPSTSATDPLAHRRVDPESGSKSVAYDFSSTFFVNHAVTYHFAKSSARGD